MKYLALALVALVTALGFAAPASAQRLPVRSQPFQVNISHDRTSLILFPMSHGKPTGMYYIGSKHNERWFQIADAHGKPAFVQYWTSPGGSPLVPDTSQIIAAVQGLGAAGLTYDTNGNLLVSLSGGGATLDLPLPGGSSTAVGNNQSVGIQAYDGSANLVPLQEINGSLNVNLTTQSAGLVVNSKIQPFADNTVSGAGLQTGCSGSPVCTQTIFSGAKTLFGMEFLSGTAMIAGQSITCYDSLSGSGTILIQAAQMGAGQIITIPGGGESLTAGFTCVTAGAVLTVNQFIKADAR